MNAARDRSTAARILLIAAIAYAWTGLAVCKASCAEAAGLRPAAAQTAPPGHADCHGQGIPAPAQTPERSPGPEQSVCCCSLDLAQPGEGPVPAQGAIGIPSALLADAGEIPAPRATPCAWHPPRRLNSPYDRGNPPLLS
jgi:hypothetical protein